MRNKEIAIDLTDTVEEIADADSSAAENQADLKGIAVISSLDRQARDDIQHNHRKRATKRAKSGSGTGLRFAYRCILATIRY